MSEFYSSVCFKGDQPSQNPFISSCAKLEHEEGTNYNLFNNEQIIYTERGHWIYVTIKMVIFMVNWRGETQVLSRSFWMQLWRGTGVSPDPEMSSHSCPALLIFPAREEQKALGCLNQALPFPLSLFSHQCLFPSGLCCWI